MATKLTPFPGSSRTLTLVGAVEEGQEDLGAIVRGLRDRLFDILDLPQRAQKRPLSQLRRDFRDERQLAAAAAAEIERIEERLEPITRSLTGLVAIFPHRWEEVLLSEEGIRVQETMSYKNGVLVATTSAQEPEDDDGSLCWNAETFELVATYGKPVDLHQLDQTRNGLVLWQIYLTGEIEKLRPHAALLGPLDELYKDIEAFFPAVSAAA